MTAQEQLFAKTKAFAEKKTETNWLKPSKLTDNIIVEALKKTRKIEKASDEFFG